MSGTITAGKLADLCKEFKLAVSFRGTDKNGNNCARTKKQTKDAPIQLALDTEHWFLCEKVPVTKSAMDEFFKDPQGFDAKNFPKRLHKGHWEKVDSSRYLDTYQLEQFFKKNDMFSPMDFDEKEKLQPYSKHTITDDDPITINEADITPFEFREKKKKEYSKIYAADFEADTGDEENPEHVPFMVCVCELSDIEGTMKTWVLGRGRISLSPSPQNVAF
jgi:hypothetical protein